jgi:hypothetical protein
MPLDVHGLRRFLRTVENGLYHMSANGVLSYMQVLKKRVSRPMVAAPRCLEDFAMLLPCNFDVAGILHF